MVNEQYSAVITDVNTNGESLYNVTVEFGMYTAAHVNCNCILSIIRELSLHLHDCTDTYDVQSVHGSAILELSCTFVERLHTDSV